MNYFAIVAAINALSSLSLGYFVYAKNRQGKVNQSFFVYCLSATIWSVGYFFWQVSDTQASALFWCKFLMMGAIMIPVLQTRFIRRVLNLRVEKRLLFLLYLYSAIFLISNFGDYIVATVVPRAGFKFWPVAGAFFIQFLLVWIGIVVYNFVLILTHFYSLNQKTRLFLTYIMIATLISYAGGITNYPLWFNIEIRPWGNILVSVYVIIVAYAVIRNKFLKIEVMKSEIAVFSVFLLLVIDALLSDQVWIGLMRFGMVILFALIGWNYLKSFFEIEKRNKQLKRDKKELQDLDRMKDEFLQMATHELNTPITVIMGKLDMAISENMCNLNEKQKNFLLPVLEDSKRLAGLSKDILNVARIDQHRLKLDIAENDYIAMVSNIVDNYAYTCKKKNLKIAFLKPSMPTPYLPFDSVKITEVITNLLNNAIKFTDKGVITVRVIRQKDEIVTSVTDTGVGIDEKDQALVFNKFYQVDRFDQSNPLEQQGSGLGLYISKNIVELHGGKMGVESKKGKGSTFYFSLPLEYTESRTLKKNLHIRESKVRVL